jgi:hypothetical protein
MPPLPSVPAPSTWSSEQIATVPQLRADVSDAVAFLSQRPLVVLQNNQGVTWASFESYMGMNVDVADTWGGHYVNSATLWQYYYAQAPGWYLCKGAVPFDYTSTTQNLFAAGFEYTTSGIQTGPVRGPLTLMGSGYGAIPQVCDLIEQVNTGPIGGSGDWIEFTALNNTGSGVVLESQASQLPYWSARWVCATSGTQPLPVPSNPAFPVPPAVLGHAFMNTNVRDAIRFLTYPPVCKLYYTAGSSGLPTQAFPAGTVVPLNTVTVDNYSAATTGAGCGYTAPVAGTYFCYNQVSFQGTSTATSSYAAGLQVNSGTITWGDATFQNAASTSTGAGAQIGRRLRLSPGDFVQPVGMQSSGATLDLNAAAANQSRFIVVWESS